MWDLYSRIDCTISHVHLTKTLTLTPQGASPLFVASQEGHAQVVDLLLASKANAETSLQYEVTSRPHSPPTLTLTLSSHTHIALPHSHSLPHPHPLPHPPSPPTPTQEGEGSLGALEIAIKRGHVDAVKAFLAHRPDLKDSRTTVRVRVHG